MRAVLLAPFTRRAWAEAAYCLLSFPVALVGLVSALILLALGVALTASVVGAGPGVVLGVLVADRRVRPPHAGALADRRS